MSVRLRLALTILVTGLATALAVITTVGLAFQRFEHENTYDRANAFLGRAVAQYEDLLDLQQRNPEDFTAFLRNLLLFEPGSQLYLLAADGTVLAHTGQAQLGPGFKVALLPVQQAAEAAQGGLRMPYVMGDDPEHMDSDAVVAARALRRAVIRPSEATAGYLYIVCRSPAPAGTRLALFRSSLAGPALAAVAAVIVLTTLLAAWIITAVTRPLRVLSDEVAAAARDGFTAVASHTAAQAASDDEFGRLRSGFRALLATLRQQWDELRRLDHFRRESVSNLSHDLRSPLTATVACLDTLNQRWAGDPARAEDRRLLEVALRNTHNAARLVRSLGDLALLDEPEFKLHPMRVDLSEVLDDIALRFAQRATQQALGLRFEQRGTAAPVADVDIELFERAVANLLDNALKFTPSGGSIVLSAERAVEHVAVVVQDSGVGIAPHDIEHLFDRHYQNRGSVAPATSEDGKGLGLAIVKRIVELHRGTVAVASVQGQGTTVTLRLTAG
jgi:signal transduction histidine kinase